MEEEAPIFLFPHSKKYLPDIVEYLKHGLHEREEGRYRYTQIRNAETIVVSQEGRAMVFLRSLEGTQ